MRILPLVVILSALSGSASRAAGQEAPAPPQDQDTGQEKDKDKDGGTSVTYGRDGLVIESEDGNYRAQIRFRLQFRLSYPFDADTTTPEDFEDRAQLNFAVRRARFKLGGNAIRPWIDYYIEYDFTSSRLLDFRVTLERLPELMLRLGQWKVEYNRERRDSSGEQQFVDRSIVNAPFTIDRQEGLQLTGRVLQGTPLDSTYFAGVFTGHGKPTTCATTTPTPCGWSATSGTCLDGCCAFAVRREGAARSRRRAWRCRRSGTGAPSPPSPAREAGSSSDTNPARPGSIPCASGWRKPPSTTGGFSFQHEFHWKRILDNTTGIVTKPARQLRAGGHVRLPAAAPGSRRASRWRNAGPSSIRTRPLPATGRRS